ncbi:MAG: WYL domain-containing protein [Actinobacteria bacterium]|nr:WYL domain-containing protein [Actinomycetota bacterium]MBW3650837.1 WYL domain-containing protein [Actinomycetota bacterium]
MAVCGGRRRRQLMARASSNFAGRLRRMLVMVPWLLEQGGSTVAELARRFDVSEEEVVRDLNLVMCCGVPPYGADQLVSVVLDEDGSVLAWKGPFFNRPMRLTPAEGFAVLAAGRALLAVPGAERDGPLAAALEKLEAAVGSSASIAVELESPELLGTVREAAARGHRLAVTYYSAWRDELTERVIDPFVVFSREARWYVAGRDSGSGEVRHFRLDRLRAAEPTGETFERPADFRVPDRTFSGGPEAVEVELELPPAARWVVESYDPLAVEELDGGRLRVRLAVAGERWLERLLLRVGPEARVVSPPRMADLGAAAARRLLERYG